MDVAARNRLIKQILVKEYGKGNVTVRGSRGTAYGWVSVEVRTELNRTELTAQVWALLEAAGLGQEIGTYGYNDPGSDYGYGRRIHIDPAPLH